MIGPWRPRMPSLRLAAASKLKLEKIRSPTYFKAQRSCHSLVPPDDNLSLYIVHLSVDELLAGTGPEVPAASKIVCLPDEHKDRASRASLAVTVRHFCKIFQTKDGVLTMSGLGHVGVRFPYEKCFRDPLFGR